MRRNHTAGKRGYLFLFQTILIAFFIIFTCPKSRAACGTYDSIIITHDTTWYAVPSNFHGFSITLNPGVTFTIDGTYGLALYFSQYARIFNVYDSTDPRPVHLVVKNGAVLGACANSWLGISITGVPDAKGNYSEYTYDSVHNSISGENYSQSSVSILSSDILNAYCGVQALYHTIVKITGSQFITCRTGVNITTLTEDKYFATIITSHTYVPSASYIYLTTFDIQNSNPDYHLLNQYICVYLDGTQYFDMAGNTFECSWGTQQPSNGRPTGVKGVDAGFSLHSTPDSVDNSTGCLLYPPFHDRNNFYHLSYGVDAEVSNLAVNTLTFGLHMDDCNFDDCFIGAYIKGGRPHLIKDNTFHFAPTGSGYWNAATATDYNNLLWLDHSSNFLVIGNTLKEDKIHTALMYVDNSWQDIASVQKNSFENTKAGSFSTTDDEYALRLAETNNHIVITCDSFIHHLYGIYANSGSTTSDLGDPFNGNNDGVGNIFTSWGVGIGDKVYSAGNTFNYYSVIDPSPHFGINYNSSLGTNCKIPESCRKWPSGVDPAIDDQLSLKIYPNPAQDQVIFALPGTDLRHVEIEIFDLTGRKFGEYRLTDNEPGWVLKTASYPDGFYIYRLVANGFIEKTGKFEVRH